MAAGAPGQREEVKQVSNTSKSPFRSSNIGSTPNTLGSGLNNKDDPTKKVTGSPGNGDDDIEEDIVADPDDIQLQPTSARDPIAASGGASSAVGIDQSIDTLRMEEFDYMEDVKHTPRGDI